MPRKYMNSPKIQLLPQGFATRGAQGAKISKALKSKKIEMQKSLRSAEL